MSILYLLIIEIIFGGLIISPFFYFLGKETPLLAYLLIMISSCAAFLFLLYKFKDKGKILYFIVIFPVILMIGYYVAFPIIVSFLISLFVFWRTLSNYNEYEYQNEGKWIFATILLGTVEIFVIGLSSKEYLVLIINIMIFQVGFIIICGFFKRWLELDSHVNEKKQFIIPYTLIIAIIVGAAMMLASSMNLIKWLFFTIVKACLTISVFFAKPFFDWAESQNWTERIDELSIGQGAEEEEETLLLTEEIEINNMFDPAIIAVILSLLSLVFLFIYIYKRKKIRGKKERENNNRGYLSETSFLNQGRQTFKKRKLISPSNSIRKEIFYFERFAIKLHLGREPYESLSDWMNRVGLRNFETINSVYEKVRYGATNYTEKEVAVLKNDLKQKRLDLKNIYKERRLKKNTSQTSNLIK